MKSIDVDAAQENESFVPRRGRGPGHAAQSLANQPIRQPANPPTRRVPCAMVVRPTRFLRAPRAQRAEAAHGDGPAPYPAGPNSIPSTRTPLSHGTTPLIHTRRTRIGLFQNKTTARGLRAKVNCRTHRHHRRGAWARAGWWYVTCGLSRTHRHHRRGAWAWAGWGYTTRGPSREGVGEECEGDVARVGGRLTRHFSIAVPLKQEACDTYGA